MTPSTRLPRRAFPALLVCCALTRLCPASAQDEPSPLVLEKKTTIRTLVARPQVAMDKRFPLCILLPGGRGRISEASRAMEAMGQSLAERGWIVVVPVSDDGRSFFAEAADKVVAVMDQMEDDPEVRPGRTLLAGISNGGMAALQVAGMVPGRVSGVVAVPGVLNHWTKVGRLQHLPVYLRIGAADELGWADQYEDVVRRLKNGGARVDARLLEGAGHAVPPDLDEIDAWVKRELGALGPSPKRTTRVTLPDSAARMRTWTSRNGATVEAALAEVRGNMVVLMQPEGNKLQILRENLAAGDRSYLDQLIDRADEGP